MCVRPTRSRRLDERRRPPPRPARARTLPATAARSVATFISTSTRPAAASGSSIWRENITDHTANNWQEDQPGELERRGLTVFHMIGSLAARGRAGTEHPRLSSCAGGGGPREHPSRAQDTDSDREPERNPPQGPRAAPRRRASRSGRDRSMQLRERRWTSVAVGAFATRHAAAEHRSARGGRRARSRARGQRVERGRRLGLLEVELPDAVSLPRRSARRPRGGVTTRSRRRPTATGERGRVVNRRPVGPIKNDERASDAEEQDEGGDHQPPDKRAPSLQHRPPRAATQCRPPP